LRAGRQKILERNGDSARLWVVIDESVLYRQRGDANVMAQQLDHLLKMSERPRVDLQILPLNAGAHLAQAGSFQVLNRENQPENSPRKRNPPRLPFPKLPIGTRRTSGPNRTTTEEQGPEDADDDVDGEADEAEGDA